MSSRRGRPKVHQLNGETLVVWTLDRGQLQHKFDPIPQMIRTANAAGFTALRWSHEEKRTCVRFVVHCEPRTLPPAEPMKWANE